MSENPLEAETSRSSVLFVEELHFISKAFQELVYSTLLRVWQLLQILIHSLLKQPFSPCFPQLPVLNEPCKHLRLHENAQETTNALGRHRLAKSLSLENALAALVLRDEEGVMSHCLQEEADEGL